MFFAIFASFFMGVFGFGVFQFFSNPNNVATVGATKIKLSEFLNTYNSLARDRDIGSQQQDLALKRQALNRVVATSVVQQDAKKAGLFVSDTEIRQLIANTPSFISEQGEFNLSAYQSFLVQQGSSAADYENNLKVNILHNKYLQLFFPLTKISDDLANFFQTRYNKKALTRYFQVPKRFLAKTLQVSDAKIKEFYDNAQQNYREPSSYSANLFYIAKNKVAINISEESVTNYLEKNKAEFVQKASFKSSHILFSLDGVSSSNELSAIKEQAYDVYQTLVSDKNKFAELARQYSQDPISASQGGDLGWIVYDSFAQEFEDVVKQLSIGEISEPFITAIGYHIVYLEDTKEEVFNLSQAREEVRLLLEQKQFNSFVSILLQKLTETKSYSSPNLPQEQVAVDHNITYKMNTLVTSESKYQNIALKKIYDALQKFAEQNVNIFDVAPYLSFDDLSDESADGVIVYQLLAINLGAKLPFEHVKKQVTKDLEHIENAKYLQNQVSELNKQYKIKDDFDKLTKEWKIANVENVDFVYAIPETSALSLKLKNNAFRLQPEQLRFFIDDNKLYSLVLDDFTQDSSIDFQSFSKENFELDKANVLINRFVSNILSQSKISYNSTFLKQYNIPKQ